MNKFDPANHHRRSIRLKGYDYSQGGLYYITLCTQGREHLFGSVTEGEMCLSPAGEMCLSPAGEMVENQWMALSERFPTIEMDAFVVMPNHFHGIIAIVGEPEGPENGSATVADILCTFKSLTTLEYSRAVAEGLYPPFNKRLWQRNYYEHIIRNDIAHRKITEYIYNNPAQWEEDEYR